MEEAGFEGESVERGAVGEEREMRGGGDNDGKSEMVGREVGGASHV